MFLNRDTDPSKDDVETEFPRCSLPELYALVENFNKESKKLNRLKAYGISPSEAQKIHRQNLNAVSFTRGTDLREDPPKVTTDKVVRKDEEMPALMTELLHHSLLTGSSPADRLSKSQQRLAQHGIPSPSHTFPSEMLLDKANSPAPAQKSQSTGKLSRLGISRVNPETFILEDEISEYLLVDPGNPNR